MTDQCFRCKRPIMAGAPVKTAWGAMHPSESHCLDDALAALKTAENLIQERNLEISKEFTWRIDGENKIHDLTAEVERLTAERHQLHRDWSEARDEIDALRAQLDAAGWRTWGDKPDDTESYEIREIRARGWYDEKGGCWHVFLGGDQVATPRWVEWRPAPSQE